jgi:hypothetical protein
LSITERATKSPDPKYTEWIDKNVPKRHHDGRNLYALRGKCQSFSQKMVKAFPELRLRKGFYYDAEWGQEQHYWTIDPSGGVIDPTAAQFPSRGIGVYEHLEDSELPIGKCMNCGNLSYQGAPSPYICSKECEREYSFSL